MLQHNCIEISDSIIKDNIKIELLKLPLDILIKFCSEYPILGTTCKTLYKLCPTKPIDYYYNKISEYHTSITYVPDFPKIQYHYYHIDIDFLNPIIESTAFRTLNIHVPNDIIVLNKFFRYIYENNISIDKFKYRTPLTRALKSHEGDKKDFKHLEKFDSLALSFLMYLYHSQLTLIHKIY